MSRFDGTNWVRSSNSLNLNAAEDAIQPDIGMVDGGIFADTPYVAFSQFNGSRYELRVRRPSGANWVTEGSSPLNVNGGWGAFSPQIAAAPGTRQLRGTPYVAWVEQSPPVPVQPPPPPTNRLYVKRGNIDNDPAQSSWTTLGGQVNPDTNSFFGASLAIVGGAPWVAWHQEVAGTQQVRVARYESGNWIGVGQASLNVDDSKDARTVGLANVGGTAYLVIGQRFDTAAFRSHVWVKRFDGTSWVPIGGPLNVDPALDAFGTGIASVNGVPYVTFTQAGGTGVKSQLRVSRLQAPTCQAATVEVPHNALAQSIALSCDEGVRRITGSPAHGVLSDLDGTAGTVKYTPAGGYSGPDTFGFVANDGATDSVAVTVSLNVAAPPGGGGAGGGGAGGGGAGGGTTTPPARPSLSGLRRTHGVFALGRTRTPLSGRTTARRKPTPRGTTFSFRLNVAAKVTMAVRRVRGGRRVGRRCLAPTPARRTRPRCLRLLTVKTLTRDARAGSNRIPFSGRIGTLVLPPGSYRAVFTASNAAGRSAGRTSGFTIVR